MFIVYLRSVDDRWAESWGCPSSPRHYWHDAGLIAIWAYESYQIVHVRIETNLEREDDMAFGAVCMRAFCRPTVFVIRVKSVAVIKHDLVASMQVGG